MTYINKKQRAFRHIATTWNELEPRRSEGRIKNYSSALDLRSWGGNVEQRRQHILELMVKGKTARHEAVPVEDLMEIMRCKAKSKEKRLKCLSNQLLGLVKDEPLTEEKQEKLDDLRDFYDEIFNNKQPKRPTCKGMNRLKIKRDRLRQEKAKSPGGDDDDGSIKSDISAISGTSDPDTAKKPPSTKSLGKPKSGPFVTSRARNHSKIITRIKVNMEPDDVTIDELNRRQVLVRGKLQRLPSRGKAASKTSQSKSQLSKSASSKFRQPSTKSLSGKKGKPQRTSSSLPSSDKSDRDSTRKKSGRSSSKLPRESKSEPARLKDGRKSKSKKNKKSQTSQSVSSLCDRDKEDCDDKGLKRVSTVTFKKDKKSIPPDDHAQYKKRKESPSTTTDSQIKPKGERSPSRLSGDQGAAPKGRKSGKESVRGSRRSAGSRASDSMGPDGSSDRSAPKDAAGKKKKGKPDGKTKAAAPGKKRSDSGKGGKPGKDDDGDTDDAKVKAKPSGAKRKGSGTKAGAPKKRGRDDGDDGREGASSTGADDDGEPGGKGKRGKRADDVAKKPSKGKDDARRPSKAKAEVPSKIKEEPGADDEGEPVGKVQRGKGRPGEETSATKRPDDVDKKPSKARKGADDDADDEPRDKQGKPRPTQETSASKRPDDVDKGPSKSKEDAGRPSKVAGEGEKIPTKASKGKSGPEYEEDATVLVTPGHHHHRHRTTEGPGEEEEQEEVEQSKVDYDKASMDTRMSQAVDKKKSVSRPSAAGVPSAVSGAPSTSGAVPRAGRIPSAEGAPGVASVAGVGSAAGPPKTGRAPSAEGVPSVAGAPRAARAPSAEGVLSATGPPRAGRVPSAGSAGVPGAGVPGAGDEALKAQIGKLQNKLDEANKMIETLKNQSICSSTCAKDLEQIEREIEDMRSGKIMPETLIKKHIAVIRKCCNIIGESNALATQPDKVSEMKSQVSSIDKLNLDKDVLNEKVKTMERELLQYKDLPEKLKDYQEKCDLLARTIEERDKLLDEVKRLKDALEETDKFKEDASKVGELQKQLVEQDRASKTSQMELTKARSQVGEMGDALTEARREKDVLMNQLKVCEVELSKMKDLAKENEILRMEKDKLEAKLKGVQDTSGDFDELLRKGKEYDGLKNERDLYKAKYEELVKLECHCDMLRAQLEAAKLMGVERDMLMQKVGDMQTCLCEREKELLAAQSQIEALKHANRTSKAKLDAEMAGIRSEMEKKSQLLEQQTAAEKDTSPKDLSSISDSENSQALRQRINTLEQELSQTKNTLTQKTSQIKYLQQAMQEKDNSYSDNDAVAKIKRELEAAKAENKKLQEIANKMVSITGDEHVQQMLKQSECAVKRVVEELGKQYEHWGMMKVRNVGKRRPGGSSRSPDYERSFSQGPPVKGECALLTHLSRFKERVDVLEAENAKLRNNVQETVCKNGPGGGYLKQEMEEIVAQKEKLEKQLRTEMNKRTMLERRMKPSDLPECNCK